jgi:hypothetical protein
MRFSRILLFVVLASAFAGFAATDAKALGFEDNPCPLTDPVDRQLKVCTDAEVNKPYTTQAKGKGGCTPDSVKYKISGGELPPGLTISSSDGTISGTPSKTGVYKFYVQVRDIPASAGGAFWCSDEKISDWQFQIKVLQGLQIQQRQSTLTPAVVDATYNLQLTATGGGGGALTWSVSSGALPAGVTLNSSTGLLSGKPTQAGDAHFQVKVTDGTRSDVQTYTLPVVQPLAIAKPSAPNAEVGRPFTLQLTATGGRAPYTWTAEGLPAGFTLDASKGILSGTPDGPTTAAVKVTVTDSLGLKQTLEVSVPIAAKLAVVKKVLHTAHVGRRYSARLFATGGVAPRNWEVIRGRLPAHLELDPSTGRITGTPAKAGTYRFRVQVTDGLQVVSSASFVLKVAHR